MNDTTRLCKHCRRRPAMIIRWGEPHVLCEPCAILNVLQVNRGMRTLTAEAEAQMVQAHADLTTRDRVDLRSQIGLFEAGGAR